MSGRAPLPQELAVGRPVPWPIHDRSGKLLLKKGEVVVSEGVLEAVLARGRVLDRDLAAADIERQEVEPDRENEADARSVFLKLRRLPPALETTLLLFRQPGGERALAHCRLLIDALVEACARDPDAALAAFQIDAGDDVGNTAAMGLHAAVLCDRLAQAAGMSLEDRRPLLGASLTHDIGMFPLADALVRQKIALSSDQREVLAQHTEFGCALLRDAGVNDDIWLRAVAEHHERIDGSGYPRGLSGHAISLGAQILALVDIYTAMIRPRAYRSATPCREALRELFLERGKQVDESLASLFIRELGLFPPGLLVRLRSGEVGVVTRRGATTATPEVRALISASGVPISRPPIRDPGEPHSAIVGCEPVARYRSVLTRVHELWAESPVGAVGAAG